MDMRQSSLLALSAGVVLLLVACGGTTPPPTAGPGGGTPATVATPRPGGGGGTGTECAAIPTFSLQNPNPSFAPDPELLAKFPQSIGGAPATDVGAFPFGSFLCLGGQAGYSQAVANLPPGTNWAAISLGSATYELAGDEVELSAFRTPGSDPRALVDALFQLAAQNGQADVGTVSQGSIGGKSVIIVTDSGGDKTYAYASGDTLYFLEEGLPDTVAATVLAALP